MERKTITKTEKVYEDKCKICKKVVRGYSVAQAESRMSMHMRSHKGEKK